jgi:hypothetical protein
VVALAPEAPTATPTVAPAPPTASATAAATLAVAATTAPTQPAPTPTAPPAPTSTVAPTRALPSATSPPPLLTAVPKVAPTTVPPTVAPTAVPPSATPTTAPARAAGSVAGQVFWFVRTRPLEGITVQLLGGSQQTTVVASAKTNAQGRYRFDNVPAPDEYRVCANRGAVVTPYGPFCADVFSLNNQETKPVDLWLTKLDIVIRSPEQNATAGAQPTFRWERYPEATRYSVTVLTDGDFTILFRRETTELSLVSPVNLQAGKRYVFVVQAEGIPVDYPLAASLTTFTVAW